MKKIILLTSIAFFLIQCNKTNELPELAKDNDYESFELKDRVCEISQKVTLLEETKFTIDDKNINFFFSNEGYLISDELYNNNGIIVEENTYEKFTLPLTQKIYKC